MLNISDSIADKVYPNAGILCECQFMSTYISYLYEKESK